MRRSGLLAISLLVASCAQEGIDASSGPSLEKDSMAPAADAGSEAAAAFDASIPDGGDGNSDGGGTADGGADRPDSPDALPDRSGGDALGDPRYREGFGKNVTGGSGQPTCIVQTSTDMRCFYQDGVHSGSFSDRIVVFAVDAFTPSETIRPANNVTIDGCANGRNGVTINHPTGAKRAIEPEDRGPGTTIGNLIFSCLNVQGAAAPSNHVTEDDNLGLDGTNGGKIVGVLFDRITSAQASDGALDITGNIENVTVQRSLFHDNAITMLIKYGTRKNFSIHHNVFVHDGERNPQVRGDMQLLDFVNNVLFIKQGDVTAYGDGTPTDPYGIRIWNSQSGTPSLDGNVTINVTASAHLGDRGRIELITDPDASAAGVYIGPDNYCSPASNCPASPRATPNGVPAEYAVTTLPVSHLKSAMLPYVGAPNRTAADQGLLDGVAAVLP